VTKQEISRNEESDGNEAKDRECGHPPGSRRGLWRRWIHGAGRHLCCPARMGKSRRLARCSCRSCWSGYDPIWDCVSGTIACPPTCSRTRSPRTRRT
jgi:hypothetical protein